MNGRKSQAEPAPADAAPAGTLVGSVVAERYRVEGELGAGGFGIVYRAEDMQAGRTVALKVLREEFFERKALRRRFAREAKALMTLAHPNIVAITDYGVSDRQPFLAMELLSGQTLDRRIKAEGPLPESCILPLMEQLLSGLHYMHGRGIVHRDLKPANIFLAETADGQVRPCLLDFGLAKFLVSEDRTEGMTLTRSGDVFGTPSYMPPEQLLSGDIDARTDVYSAGVVLFEMASGRRPFVGKPHDVMRRALVDPAPSILEATGDRMASPELEAVLQRALAKEATARFDSAADFAQALRELRPPLLRSINPAQALLAVDDTLLSPAAASPPPPAARRGSALGRLARRALVLGARAVSVLAVAFILVAGVAIYTLSKHPPEGQGGALPASSTASGSPLREAQKDLPRVAAHEQPAQVAKGAAASEEASEPAVASPSKASRSGSAADAPAVNVALSEVVSEAAPAAPAAPVEDPEQGLLGAAQGAASSQVEEAAPAPPQHPTVRARNPWRGRTPRVLASLRRALVKGWNGSERTLSTLRRYNREHPDDPRGHLLLAIVYMNRSWERDVVTQYGFAVARDPASRGDARMLRDLVNLAGQGSARREAQAMLRDVYGAEALPAVKRARMRAKEDAVRKALSELEVELQQFELAAASGGAQ